MRKRNHTGRFCTSYNRDACNDVIPLGDRGLSIEEISRSLGVARKTIDNWRAKHPEFDCAMIEAIERSQAWWLQQGRENLHNKDFNTALWIFNVKNRLRSIGWSDRQEIKHDLKVEEIKITYVNPKVAGN